MDYPVARQTLTESGETRRTVECPEHGATSLYIGVVKVNDEVLWELRCAKPYGRVHMLWARPDPHAPRRLEEVEEWVKREKARR